jgi:broad specificity phosphatase PhoE
MKIYFTSHADSIDNQAGLASGWNDVALSELGVRQAVQMAAIFQDIKIDIICCSDLKRAVDTVTLAFGERPFIIDKRLRELNYGDFNGKPSAVVEPLKTAHLNEPFPRGESYSQALARTHAFFKELKKKHPEKTILVVGHRVTRYGLETLTGEKTIKECLGAPFNRRPYWEYDL